MKRLELQLVITEDNGKWSIATFVPDRSCTILYTSDMSRNTAINKFTEYLKDDTLRYWHIMEEVE